MTATGALVAVAYDTLLRRSELVALQVADLMVEMDGSGSLLVQRGKTDPGGEGALQYLAPDTIQLVRVWLKRSGVFQGYLFRSLRKDGQVGTRLDDRPGTAYLQGHGQGCGLERCRGGRPVRTQCPGGCGAGHESPAALSCRPSCKPGAGRTPPWCIAMENGY